MVADLSRYHGLRLHRRSLSSGEVSLPFLAACVEHLPPGSAVWAAEHDLPYGWSLSDVLLTDVFHALTGNAHPARAEITSAARARSAVSRLRAQAARLRKRAPAASP